MIRYTRGLLLALLSVFLALPSHAQSIGQPIAAHPGDTLHVTYVVPPTGLYGIRAVTSTGKILVQSLVSVTPRPVPPPVQPPVDTTPKPQPPPIATGSCATIVAWLCEDFTEYGGSSATFKADPRHIWSTGEDGDFVTIGVMDAVGGASWRLDWPDRTADAAGRCHDFTIGRNLTFPGSAGEVWMEATVRFSFGWTTVAPASWSCASAASYKMLFARSDVGRFGLYVGIFGTGYEVSYAGNEDPAPGGAWSESGDGLLPLFDGAYHVVRLHFRAGANGIAELWLDGKKIRSIAGASSASSMYGGALGRNINQGPAAPQSLWYRRILVYNSNPGW